MSSQRIVWIDFPETLMTSTPTTAGNTAVSFRSAAQLTAIGDRLTTVEPVGV